MAISLKVLAPNKNVYQGEAEEVILPSTTGQNWCATRTHLFSYCYRYWCFKAKNEFPVEINRSYGRLR